jgi:hypothetical protein
LDKLQIPKTSKELAEKSEEGRRKMMKNADLNKLAFTELILSRRRRCLSPNSKVNVEIAESWVTSQHSASPWRSKMTRNSSAITARN